MGEHVFLFEIHCKNKEIGGRSLGRIVDLACVVVYTDTLFIINLLIPIIPSRDNNLPRQFQHDKLRFWARVQLNSIIKIIKGKDTSKREGDLDTM